MAVLFRTEEVKTAIPTASKRYAPELMKEANANREAHGKALFNDGEPPKSDGKSGGTAHPK